MNRVVFEEKAGERFIKKVESVPVATTVENVKEVLEQLSFPLLAPTPNVQGEAHPCKVKATGEADCLTRKENPFTGRLPLLVRVKNRDSGSFPLV